MAKQKATSKKRNVRVDAIGQLHVHSSFNNIIVSLTNNEGQIISWSSAGKMGFRGSKKNTPYAAQMAAEDCAKVAFDLGLRNLIYDYYLYLKTILPLVRSYGLISTFTLSPGKILM